MVPSGVGDDAPDFGAVAVVGRDDFEKPGVTLVNAVRHHLRPRLHFINLGPLTLVETFGKDDRALVRMVWKNLNRCPQPVEEERMRKAALCRLTFLVKGL